MRSFLAHIFLVLLPFATLARTAQPETLLQRVAQRISQLDGAQRSAVLAYAKILAGLKFERLDSAVVSGGHDA